MVSYNASSRRGLKTRTNPECLTSRRAARPWDFGLAWGGSHRAWCRMLINGRMREIGQPTVVLAVRQPGIAALCQQHKDSDLWVNASRMWSSSLRKGRVTARGFRA